MNEQTKKFAYFPVQDRQIHVLEALWLRNQGIIEMNRENPAFFDFKNPSIRSGVLPVSPTFSGEKKIKDAFYRYYHKEDMKQILYSKKMTTAHFLFQMMFSQLNQFKIEDKEKKEIRVAIESAEIESYIKYNDKKGILIDILLHIKQTDPYSYKYLWNKKLAIEVKVTHAVDPKKRRILRDNNISTYEAPVPNVIKKLIPKAHEILKNKMLRQKEIDKLTKIYSKNSWTLFGDFIVNSKVEDENKENYLLLSQAEIELDKYKKKKRELSEEIQKSEEYKLHLSKIIHKLNKDLYSLKEKVEVNQELLLASQRNNDLVLKLKQKEQQIENLKKENDILKNNLNKLHDESFLKWIKRKIFK
ncbi:hypothetical protein [Bacillus pumilus]|uniref:hypothetical protein n=1 Tax=Bacillus pumilus TaxID=1408 RepID=UPI00209DF1F0|nr:hypothetical protein [Bacillus pumilus]MCP1531108.1 cell division protein FtsB [Bacillus pumilus]MDF9786506.1 cell division protein FtsB [Bacillus pumilus]